VSTRSTELSLHYIRYTASQADVHVYKALSGPPDATAAPHAARWYRHIQSYETEFRSLPGSSKAGEALTASTSAPSAAATAAEDDDDVDLFGSDDEEDDAEAERIKAERVAEYAAKKANKPKTIAKVRAFALLFVI
jgi:elongation factor 1-beta